ncbi:Rpn family recombination-promoting nuclease/putative transposase [Archangium sp.]|uniref:Rpn family recombination-promoting nuclease/putative transposase n=1 Tax=Archangium sp. TaxID=1872627 RepID=UPI002D233BE0|nr:Rpn family recombination-promoting nuclease/putative transposase [Archangium sp.]HYO52314.1 Rpn family recombination-promoting nuclease/putative transposase [Archangium sp.]
MSGPHDLLVRFTFGHPERAAAELRAALPAHVVSQVDWASLRREPGSVVDVELRETESDLLFSARLSGGRPVLFYVLLEHQSSVDGWMALRMLRYVVRQLEHWRQEHPGSGLLPVIIPLVLYHGPGGGWSAPRRVEELFDVPSEGEESERWRALVPRFEYRVDDLTAERAEALMARPGPPLVRLALLALRYGRTKELAERLPGWAALLEQLQAAPGGLEELSAVFHYLLMVGDEEAQAATVGMLKSVVGAQRAEEWMPTWSEKHFEQGRQQGKAEGRAEYLLRILAARGVPVDDQSRQRIMSCTDMATLDLWFERALKATRLSEVLGDLAQ